jgi:hypothetical protein
MRDGVAPGCLNFIDRPAHADRINPRRCAERSDRDRRVVAVAGGIDHMGEKKCPSLTLGEAALKLPAHQRVQFGVLVDRTVDAGDQPLRLERRQVLLEIQRRPIGKTGMAVRGRYIEHDRSLERLVRRETTTCGDGKAMEAAVAMLGAAGQPMA